MSLGQLFLLEHIQSLSTHPNVPIKQDPAEKSEVPPQAPQHSSRVKNNSIIESGMEFTARVKQRMLC